LQQNGFGFIILGTGFQARGASMSARHCLAGAIFALSVATPLLAQTTDVEFF
jgi:hypothetical protein